MIFLAIIGSATGILFWLLDGGSGPSTPSIGGGGYSLDDFVYSWLLVLLSGASMIFALVAGLVLTDWPGSRGALIIAGFGAFILLLTLALHGQDLS